MDLSHDAWIFLGVLITQVAGVTVVWLKLRKGRQDAHEAAIAAKQAAELSKPTGNGWAERVDKKLDNLIRITYETKRTAELALDEITEHKNTHVAAQLGIPIRRVK